MTNKINNKDKLEQCGYIQTVQIPQVHHQLLSGRHRPSGPIRVIFTNGQVTRSCNN